MCILVDRASLYLRISASNKRFNMLIFARYGSAQRINEVYRHCIGIAYESHGIESRSRSRRAQHRHGNDTLCQPAPTPTGTSTKSRQDFVPAKPPSEVLENEKSLGRLNLAHCSGGC